jgi:hypothetical protein
LSLYSASERFSTIETGVFLMIETANPTEKKAPFVITPLTPSVLANDVKQEKLTMLDTKIGTLKGNVPERSPLPELISLLHQRAAIWHGRNVDCRAAGFLQKAQEWGERRKQMDQGWER